MLQAFIITLREGLRPRLSSESPGLPDQDRAQELAKPFMRRWAPDFWAVLA